MLSVELRERWDIQKLMFASRCNIKCKSFFAWKNDPEALAVDAFTVNWNSLGLFWAFPPFALILKVLKKSSGPSLGYSGNSSLDCPTTVPIINESIDQKAFDF